MMRTLVLALGLSFATSASAQGDPASGLRVPGDSVTMRVLSIPTVNSGRDSTPAIVATTPQWCRNNGTSKRIAQTAVTGTFIGGNLALYEYFRRAWWSGERAPFFLNYDWDGNFRDQDKLGHAMGGYLLAEGGRELLEAACMSEKKATLWAVVYAAAFQMQIEVWDGTQARYGFSPPDLLFNTIGQGISAGSMMALSWPLAIVGMMVGARLGIAFLMEGSPSAVLGPMPCMARRLVSIITR